MENKKLWLIDQRPVMDKSTQSDIKTLLDLYNRKVVDARYVVEQVKPAQLNEILHPVINPGSVTKMKCLRGGITGAPGAAIGRVYFTTETLLDAYREAQQKGEDTRLILTMPATFAEDVKAIEVATGVLSTEGGYSAHASVVARQYGKVSLVKPEMRIRGKKATIGDVVINEGDVITLNVPYYGEPSIYLGKAELIEPNPEDSGLLEFIELIKQFITGFHVRVNADTPRDAALARTFGADGIGLCRTEHMFFDDKRINVFREMILADNLEERKEALDRAPAHPEERLLQAVQDHGRQGGDHPPPRRAAARVPAAQRRRDEEVRRLHERARAQEEAGREGDPRPLRGAERVQPHARPPRLPHRRVLPRDLRDAGAGHLRGGLHAGQGGGGDPSRDHDPDHHERRRAEAHHLRQEDRGQDYDPRPGRGGAGGAGQA